MYLRSMCNFCINLDQIPTVILDQNPWKKLDQSTVDPYTHLITVHPAKGWKQNKNVHPIHPANNKKTPSF